MVYQCRNLQCAKCNTIIGTEDPSVSGWRLLKANVSLNTIGSPQDSGVIQWQSYPTELIVAAQLLELIQRESARRFVVHSRRRNGLLVIMPLHFAIHLTDSIASYGYLILTFVILLPVVDKTSMLSKL